MSLEKKILVSPTSDCFFRAWCPINNPIPGWSATMSSGQNQVLIKLQQYAEKIEKTEYHTESSNGDEPYEMRINKALQQLQEQVKQHQDAFERVCRLRKTRL